METKVKELCSNKNVKLLYAVYYGSHLYGLDNPESDIDIKGIFLQSKEDCYLLNVSKSISSSTGDDSKKNTKEDIDIQLWGLHYWLDLVAKGDTNALDILYAHTHKEKVIYCDSIFEDYFLSNPLKLYNPIEVKAYIGYAVSQAKRYGIRGSRFGILKSICNDIKPNMKDNPEDKLIDYIDSIVKFFGHENFCFSKDIQNGEQTIKSLVLLNKVYLGNITLREAFNRMDFACKQYGDRSKRALENNGVDYKALHHAIRAIIQMRMLLDNKTLKYPFTGKDRELLLSIKRGEIEYEEVENIIVSGIDEIDSRQDQLIKNKELFSQYDKKYVHDCILNMYEDV